MSLRYGPATHIELPDGQRQAIVEHCRQVLEAYRQGRSEECKAFGLVCGTIAGQVITVADCCPLHRNVRSQSPHKERMDRIMAEHAIPSKTPPGDAGLGSRPGRTLCPDQGVPEQGADASGDLSHALGGMGARPGARDTPTTLDAVLGEESGLLMFIVSMVEPARPIIRVFYEGSMGQELPVR